MMPPRSVAWPVPAQSQANVCEPVGGETRYPNVPCQAAVEASPPGTRVMGLPAIVILPSEKYHTASLKPLVVHTIIWASAGTVTVVLPMLFLLIPTMIGVPVRTGTAQARLGSSRHRGRSSVIGRMW